MFSTVEVGSPHEQQIIDTMPAYFQLCLFIVAAVVCSVSGSKVQGADISKIIDSCYDYLEQHLCEGRKWGKPFHFYRPSVEKYTADQWLWDSGAHMIVWSQKNVNNAVLDMRTMLQMQQPDGRPLLAADIRSRTATVLKDRFARIATTAQACEALS